MSGYSVPAASRGSPHQLTPQVLRTAASRNKQEDPAGTSRSLLDAEYAATASAAAANPPPKRSFFEALSNSVSGPLGALRRLKNSAVGAAKTIAFGSPEEQQLNKDLIEGAKRNAELDRIHANQMKEKKAAANAEEAAKIKAAANAAAAEAAAKSSKETKDAYNGWLESIIRDVRLEPVFKAYELVENSPLSKSYPDLHKTIFANPTYIKAYTYWKAKQPTERARQAAQEQAERDAAFREKRARDPRYAPLPSLHEAYRNSGPRTRRDPKRAFVQELVNNQGWDATKLPGKLVHSNLVGSGYMIIDEESLPEVPQIGILNSYIQIITDDQYFQMLRDVRAKRNRALGGKYAIPNPYSINNERVNPFDGDTKFPMDNNRPEDFYGGDPDRPYRGGKSCRRKNKSRSRKSRKTQSRKNRKTRSRR